MRAPDFWHTDSALGAVMAPLGFVYAASGRLRRHFAKPFKAGVPVICAGNLVTGGVGKTPVVQSLVSHLQGRGKKPAILLRGYKGSQTGPLVVDPASHTAKQVGDEALLHAGIALTIVSVDRAEGAKAAVAAGADCIVMDDGFQNPGLHQDLALIVADGATGFGNGRVFPAGPLREPIADGVKRAKAAVIIGEDRSGVAEFLHPLPIYMARIEADESAAILKGQSVVAFAGIGRPEKFFATLNGVGAIIAMAFPFPDHHAYTHCEIEALLDQAKDMQARLVTTAKDHVRLPLHIQKQVDVLTVSLVWEDAEAPEKILKGYT